MLDFFSDSTLQIILLGAVTGFGSAIGSTIGSFIVQRLFLKKLEESFDKKQRRKKSG